MMSLLPYFRHIHASFCLNRLCQAQHRAHGPRPDLALGLRAHVLRLERRQQDHIESPNEIVGNPTVQVVDQVADADPSLSIRF